MVVMSQRFRHVNEIECGAAVVFWTGFDVEPTIELGEIFDERRGFPCLPDLSILLFESSVERRAEDFLETPTEKVLLVHLGEFLGLLIDEVKPPL